MTDIVVNSKTYSFSSDTGGIVTFLEASGGIPSGFSKLTFQLNPPSKAGSLWRVDIRLYLPVVAADDSECQCTGALLREEDARFSFNVPNSGTLAERTDFALRAKDLLANSQVLALLESFTRPK